MARHLTVTVRVLWAHTTLTFQRLYNIHTASLRVQKDYVTHFQHTAHYQKNKTGHHVIEVPVQTI